MRGLFVKDFRLLTNQKKFLYTIVLITIVFITAGQDMSFIVSYCTMVGMFTTVSTITYDEYDHGFTFLFTLPVTRKGYVLEKYLFIFLVGAGVWLATTLLGIAVGNVRDAEFLIADWLFASVVIFVVLMILIMIMLPINFKYGAEKSRTATMVLMLMVFTVIIVAAKFEPFIRAFKNATAGLEHIGKTGVFLLCLLVFLLVAVVSVSASVRIMKKKQF